MNLKHKKPAHILPALLLAAMLTAACGPQKDPAADYIGIEAAKEAALNAGRVTAREVTFSTAGLESDDDVFYYEVVYTHDGTEYEYQIDALNGTVIRETPSPSASANPSADGTAQGSADNTSGTTPAAPGSDENTSPAPADAADSSSETADSSLTAAGGTGGAGSAPQGNTDNAISHPQEEAHSSYHTGSSGNNTSGAVDSEGALTIALNHAGLTAQDLLFSEVKQDYEDGISVFEVEFTTSSGAEYEYEISAADGTIRSYDIDAGSSGSTASRGDDLISESQAVRIVLDRVPGAAASDVSIRLEEDDGRMEYEGKLIFNDTKYEFKLDASSGNVLEWEAELLRQ